MLHKSIKTTIFSTHDQTLSEQYPVVLGGILLFRQPQEKAMSTVTALEGHVHWHALTLGLRKTNASTGVGCNSFCYQAAGRRHPPTSPQCSGHGLQGTNQAWMKPAWQAHTCSYRWDFTHFPLELNFTAHRMRGDIREGVTERKREEGETELTEGREKANHLKIYNHVQSSAQAPARQTRCWNNEVMITQHHFSMCGIKREQRTQVVCPWLTD